MALKPARNVELYENGLFLGQTATKGVIVSYPSGAVITTNVFGSGEALDSALSSGVINATAASGWRPCGMLLDDVVNLDLTKTHQNYHKHEVNINQKVSIMTKGWAITDKLAAGYTPRPGDVAVLHTDGKISGITPVAGFSTGQVAIEALILNPTQWPKVGMWLGKVDADGFAKVYVDCTAAY